MGTPGGFQTMATWECGLIPGGSFKLSQYHRVSWWNPIIESSFFKQKILSPCHQNFFWLASFLLQTRPKWRVLYPLRGQPSTPSETASPQHRLKLPAPCLFGSWQTSLVSMTSVPSNCWGAISSRLQGFLGSMAFRCIFPWVETNLEHQKTQV